MLAKVTIGARSHFAMSAPEDYGEGAGPDQVLGVVLVVAEDLHLSRVRSLPTC